MKNLLRTFVSLFFVSIFLGCAQDSGKVIGASISTSNDGVEITIKNSGYNWEIYRYDSVSKDRDAFISGNNVRNGILKDEYVIPGHSYKYDISFYDSNWNKISRQEFPNIKPTKGKGRLAFAEKPVATYNDGNLNFKTTPTVSAADENFIGKNNISYQFYYRNFPDGGYYGRVGGGFNVFLNSDGSKRQNIFINEGYEVEDKEMVLISLSGININYDGIRYTQYYSHEELPGMPDPVTFHDNRPKVTLKDNANGVEIVIPKLNVEGVTNVLINRINVETGKWDMYMYFSDLSKTSVIDYFVEPNKSYEYRLRYRDNNGNDIITTEFNKITASHGKGSLKFSQKPVAEYESNGEMVFTTNPDVSSEIKNFVDTNSIDYGFYYRYFPDGGDTGRVGGGFNVFLNSDGTKKQNYFINEGYNVDGRKMVLIDSSYIRVRKDGVYYNQSFSYEELRGMPNSVNFVKYNKQ